MAEQKSNKVAHPKAKEYRIWSEAKYRCHNPNNKRYEYYGARGITMCTEWRNSFNQFMSDMGPRPLGYTLERVNNDGPYSKENCKWASLEEQGRNRRSNVRITHNGITLTIAEWAERTGLPYKLIHDRFRRGMEDVFSPIRMRYSHSNKD